MGIELIEDDCLRTTDEVNAPLLVPQLPTAALYASTAGSDLSIHAKASLVLEAEQEIRTIERELREIETLEKRGVAGAGRLAGESIYRAL